MASTGERSEITNMTHTADSDSMQRQYKTGYQGVPGSFSHQALHDYFGENTVEFNYVSFRDVFQALEHKEIDYGVLPIENSSTGGIAEVYDLLGKYDFYIVGEKCIEVEHNLLAVEGTVIDDIEEVYSHSQGFMQCSEFISLHPEWKQIPYFNTARSAEYVSREKSKTKACIAGRRAAAVYGLNILAANINDNKNNSTRFIVIGRNMCLDSRCNKISIVFTLPHKSGTLYGAIKQIAENNSSMVKIESRPIAGMRWQYLFYIDIIGSLLDENTKKMLDRIKEQSLSFKLLGNYMGDADY